MKKVLSCLLVLCILLTCGTVCLASGEYRSHENWVESSFDEVTEKYNNGEKFIFCYYRKDICQYSESIGNSVIRDWMDDGEKIYGVDCDIYKSWPVWFIMQLQTTSITLPVVMFVSPDGTTQTYKGLDAFSDETQDYYCEFTGRENKNNIPVPCSYTVTYHQSDARTIFDEVNEFRTSGTAWYWDSTDTQKVYTGSLGALTYDYGLEQIAMVRAAELVASFAHVRPNGQQINTIYSDTGSSTMSENISYGYYTPSDAQRGWEEEDESYEGQGHRRNMLDERYRAVGIACAEYMGRKFWVQEFSTIVDNPTYSIPCDDEKRVTVDVLNKFIVSRDYVASAQAYELEMGQSESLPEVTYEVEMSGMPYSVLKDAVHVQWSVDDTDIVSLSDGYFTACGVGSTALRATVDEQEIVIPISVSPVEIPTTEPTVEPTEPTATEPTEPTATEAEPVVEPTEPTQDEPGFYGDANNDGDVNMKDVLLIRKYIAGMDVALIFQNADVNGDGFINMKDVLVVRKFMAGLIKTLGA